MKANPRGYLTKYFHFGVFTPAPDLSLICPQRHYNLFNLLNKG